jgi:hypothetical protein
MAFQLVTFACVVLYFVFSDLKGIWTDEGIRLAAINGNRLFEGDSVGTAADLPGVWAALSTTNYQPLYYILQNLIMQISKSRDLVLLKSVNILLLLGCILVTLRMTRTWPLLARWYLAVTTFFSGYLLMHVLQVREYMLGLLFLALVYSFTFQLLQRELREPAAWNPALYAAYGALVGVASLNSFWIVPAWAGALAALLFVSRRRMPTAAGIAIAGAVLLLVFSAIHVVQGFGGKVDVGVWDPNAGLFRGLSMALGGLSYIVTGEVIYELNTGLTLRELTRAAPALIVIGGVTGFAAFFPLRRALGSRPLAPLEIHCVLSLLMFVALLAFQAVYYIGRRDTLPMWLRYFFQHFWLLHVLMAAVVGCLVLNMRGKWGAMRERWMAGAGLAVLLVAGTIWSIKGSAAYYANPYADTILSPGCEWRTLAPKVRDFARGDAIVFGRLLEGATMTYSARFLNKLFVLDRMPSDRASWPSSFVFVEIKGIFSKEVMEARLSTLHDGGFRVVEVQSIDAGPTPCAISAAVIRLSRTLAAASP